MTTFMHVCDKIVYVCGLVCFCFEISMHAMIVRTMADGGGGGLGGSGPLEIFKNLRSTL